MATPLYHNGAPTECPRDGHRGLWFSKFINTWTGSWVSQPFNEDSKRNWLNQCAGTLGHSDRIKEAASRQQILVKRIEGGKLLHTKTTSRFVTGLGGEHPVENGFRWHATLGTPYLPGTSVKGIVRTWARWSEVDDAQFQRIFGSLHVNASKNAEQCAGSVVFLDALPTALVTTEVDVMTPHYGDYYQNKATPGDWLSPVPIPFLVVAAGQSFQFGLLPRTPDAADDVVSALAWLQEALEWIGAGAKTAVGYGRFAAQGDWPMPQTWQQIADASLLANMTPIKRWEHYFDQDTVTEGHAIDFARAFGDGKEPVDLPHPVEGLLELLIERFHPYWVKGEHHPDTTRRTPFSADTLKGYAGYLLEQSEASEAESELERAIAEVKSGGADAKAWIEKLTASGLGWSLEDQKELYLAISRVAKKAKGFKELNKALKARKVLK